MRSSSVLLVVVLIFTFPLWFGLGMGLMGVIIGLAGGMIGLVAGLIGGLVGVIGWMIEGFLSLLLGWSPESTHAFDLDFFEVNGWTLAAVVLLIALVFRRKKDMSPTRR
jgi:hypothetical protein